MKKIWKACIVNENENNQKARVSKRALSRRMKRFERLEFLKTLSFGSIYYKSFIKSVGS
jgi:hypothetical protein